MIYRPILALLAATLLSACSTVLTDRNCERGLTGLQTAQEIVAVLLARGVAPEAAAKIANALVIGQVTLAAACAAVPPVATPGS